MLNATTHQSTVQPMNQTTDLPPGLQALLEDDTKLSSLPEIYIRVSELLESERATSKEIGEVVETDPALSSRILKLVNSAFYGFPSTVASISQAITILGRDRLKQLLIGTVLSGVFGKIDNPLFHMEEFWRHSVKTALLGRHLCQMSDAGEIADVIFTAGLLHDIGRLILAQKLPQYTADINSAIEDRGMPVTDAERSVLGFDHCDAGAAFIRKWSLPETLAQAAQYHHRPDQAEQDGELVKVVFIANNLVFLTPPFNTEEVGFALEDIPGWQSLGLGERAFAEAVELAEDQVHEVMDSLGMLQMRIDLDED